MTTASHIDISSALKIPGWMSERELMWLASHVADKKRIVEFGSFYGRSTRALADNSPTDAIIWAVDPWNGDYLEESGKALEKVNTFVMPHFKKNLREYINRGKVNPVRGLSYDFDTSERMDFIFIDGDHRHETVIKDIQKAILLMGSHGILCGHDYGHPLWTGVKKAVDDIFGPVETEETIWWIQL